MQRAVHLVSKLLPWNRAAQLKSVEQEDYTGKAGAYIEGNGRLF